MSFLKPDIPAIPELPPIPDESAAEDAVAEERRRLRERRGRSSTILTGASGPTGSPTVRKHTLLGE